MDARLHIAAPGNRRLGLTMNSEDVDLLASLMALWLKGHGKMVYRTFAGGEYLSLSANNGSMHYDLASADWELIREALTTESAGLTPFAVIQGIYALDHRPIVVDPKLKAKVLSVIQPLLLTT